MLYPSLRVFLIHLGWVGKVTQALMMIDTGRLEEADGVLNHIDDQQS